MKKISNTSRVNYSRPGGFVLVFFSFCLFVMFCLCALVLDIGDAFFNKHRIQLGADIAAVASAAKLRTGGWLSAAETFAELNEVDSETEIDSIEPGCFDSAATPPSFSPLDSFSTENPGPPITAACPSPQKLAVRVRSHRQVPAFFGKISGVSSLRPAVTAVAVLPESSSKNCIRPFGVEQGLLDGLETGDGFTTGDPDPGNWGKLNIGGNMSSGNRFEEAMLSDTCDESVEVGSRILTGTGFGGPINKVFDTLTLPKNYSKSQGMIIPVTSPFPNGRSDTVEILEFIKVDFVSQTGSGNNWRGTFRIVARNVAPRTETVTSTGRPAVVM